MVLPTSSRPYRRPWPQHNLTASAIYQAFLCCHVWTAGQTIASHHDQRRLHAVRHRLAGGAALLPRLPPLRAVPALDAAEAIRPRQGDAVHARRPEALQHWRQHVWGTVPTPVLGFDDTRGASGSQGEERVTGKLDLDSRRFTTFSG
jgi:hypothetical protein